MAVNQEQDGVLYSSENRIATLTLNRPNKLNAFDDDQVIKLRDALRQADGDQAVEVVIITGTGRAFSSGADVHQRQLRKREELERYGGPQAPGAVLPVDAFGHLGEEARYLLKHGADQFLPRREIEEHGGYRYFGFTRDFGVMSAANGATREHADRTSKKQLASLDFIERGRSASTR